jgi:myo-inositol 2-dehydrogenase/D-chiro-inositol 1-dehydrogenase
MTVPRKTRSSRRTFLKTTAAAGAAALAASDLLAAAQQGTGVRPGGTNLIKVGLIGCGGRGTGAAEQCVRAGPNVKLFAMGDTFRDRLDGSLRHLRGIAAIRQRIDVTPERSFVGLGAYRQVIAACDLVILATPPGFRPIHLAAAVAANKHVFTEKPVGVDGPGIRSVLATYEEANRRHLSIVAGTQRRYQTGYKESMQRIHDGALGTLLAGRCYWDQGTLWHRDRAPGMSDVEWQIRNWLYFTWLSGDHICEQHVHNLDVINWATRSHPTRAVALGGRQVRTAPVYGNIFDHFAVEYEYPNNFHLQSFCRQIDGCANNVSEALVGSQGSWTSQGYRIRGEHAWSFPRGQDNEPYLAEHVVLINSIRQGRPINALRDVAESTLTAILGRMAAYTGQDVTWEQALNSHENLMPDQLTLDMRLPVAPVAVPGRLV